MYRLLSAFALSSLALALLPAAEGRAQTNDCPLSCVLDICTLLPVNSASQTIGPYGAHASASYDLRVGVVGYDFNSGDDSSGYASAIARDRFTVIGPSSPQLVSFIARLGVRLTVTAISCCRVEAMGSLQEAGGPPVEVAATAPVFDPEFISHVDVDTVLTLPIAHLVGEPFELTYSVAGGGTGVRVTASADGALSFSGLPSGYGVVSCQGFAGVVVPTRPRTWGGVKSSYR